MAEMKPYDGAGTSTIVPTIDHSDRLWCAAWDRLRAARLRCPWNPIPPHCSDPLRMTAGPSCGSCVGPRSTLLEHPAIVAVASALLGPDFNYGSGDGHYYVGDTAWHPDEANTIW